MAAVPSIGRATRVERQAAPGADAAGDLYERYSGQIFGYCFHQLGSREEAEDAVQTTFMNAFRGLARGIVPETEQAWLFKIAHNVCLSRRRSSWRRGRVEAPNNMEVLQEVVAAKDKVADELIRLQDVLEEMPENQRRAILLREWQGLSYREIAEELELSQAAVETLIFRARRALAQGLEEAPAAGVLRRRLGRGADAGSIFVLLKTVLGGGGAAAVKVAATVVAVATAAVATTASTTQSRPAPSAPAKPRPARVAPLAYDEVAVKRVPAPLVEPRAAATPTARAASKRVAPVRATKSKAVAPTPAEQPIADAPRSPAQASQPTPEPAAVSGPKDDDRSRPAAQPLGLTVKSHKGNGKGHGKVAPAPVDPQPAVAAEALPVPPEADGPGKSELASGQQDKTDDGSGREKDK